MQLVIGSGPAGVGAALALLERGHEVTLIDYGRTLEPEFAALASPLAGRRYEDWPVATRERLAAIRGPLVDGFPMKTNFGSDYSTREAPDLAPTEVTGASILGSLARGGLSNLWGANVCSFGAGDLRGWPLAEADLAPAYRAVLAHVPLCAARDDLEAAMPLHTDTLEPRPLSAQARRVLADLERARAALRARGVTFGASRLGLRTAPRGGDAGCVECGLCLHGCPSDLIYSSAHTLAELERHPRFHYAGGHFAQRLVETADGVEVHAARAADGGAVVFRGARVYVGAGGYATARLLLGSREAYDTVVTQLESQYFLIPLLQLHAFPDAPRERLTALSQLCLRLDDPAVSAHPVHLLLYSYNPLYRLVVHETPARFVPGLERFLLARLLSLQGYLHSDDSPRLDIRLRRAASGPDTLVVEGRPGVGTRAVVRRVEARVLGMARALGAVPVPLMTRLGPPGKSFHCGGTFPMRTSPGRLESDLLGRPLAYARVHVVDSSVFPSIPATNLTLTVMANAWRIAAAASALDPAGARA